MRLRRRDLERVTRSSVDALVSTLEPEEPLPRWATHPADLTQFCAALTALNVPAIYDGDEVVGFRIRPKATR